MAAAIAPVVAFPHFSKLPTELRLKVWEAALPQEDRAALVFYHPGCWIVHEQSPGMPEYNDDGEVTIYFDSGLLRPAPVELSMCSVNHEARKIALRHVSRFGLKRQRSDSDSLTSFLRPFDPVHDYLYIPIQEKGIFLREPHDLLPADGFADYPAPSVRKLAIPEAGLETALFHEIVDIFQDLHTVVVVVGEQPEIQGRWGLREFPALCVWNADEGILSWKQSDSLSAERVRERIDEACVGLGAELIRARHSKFEVRLAEAESL